MRSFHGRARHMLVAFVLFGCGCTTPRQRAVAPELFTQKLHEAEEAWGRAEVWHSPDIEQEAKWFKPYYKQLIQAMTTERYRLLSFFILKAHGRPYAIRTLEPFLESTKGEELKWTAIALHELPYGLHPQAWTVLKTIPHADEMVSYPKSHPESHADDERYVSGVAGVEPSVWKTLSREQQWQKLKKVWGLK